MSELFMEVREANVSRREITGVVAPYDEVTRAVSDPGGELLARGAFTRSIQHRGTKVPLFLNHDRLQMMGLSTGWVDGPTELVGTFKVRNGERGDALMDEVANEYLPGMSIDFLPLVSKRRADGVVVVSEARLAGVSLVTVPAYETARVLAMREATHPTVPDVRSLFGPRPEIDLSPLPQFWR